MLVPALLLRLLLGPVALDAGVGTVDAGSVDAGSPSPPPVVAARVPSSGKAAGTATVSALLPGTVVVVFATAPAGQILGLPSISAPDLTFTLFSATTQVGQPSTAIYLSVVAGPLASEVLTLTVPGTIAAVVLTSVQGGIPTGKGGLTLLPVLLSASTQSGTGGLAAALAFANSVGSLGQAVTYAADVNGTITVGQ